MTPARPSASLPKSAPQRGNQSRVVLEVLLLSIWCGLAAGLLEVGTRVSFRAIDPTGRLFWMSRHFLWLTPLANLLVFLGLGFALAAITWLWTHRGWWLSSRIFCALTLQPALMVASPQIFPEAWIVLALGIASWLVPVFEGRPAVARRLLLLSFPILPGLVFVLALGVFAGDRLKMIREAGRAMPPVGSPNVLFIVLDTVRADHLGVYGYQRPTTPTLDRLAKRGVRFERARAPAPWTLASHASFFTGRWPHELDVEWSTPLQTDFPMLAEYMGAQGYATAGMVANINYCSSETGLDRGFTQYEDYTLRKLGFLRTSALVEEVLQTLDLMATHIGTGPILYLNESVKALTLGDARKDAATINREFLNWLRQRTEKGRPFFAFLNYFDAHAPYKLPEGGKHRFGLMARTQDELRIINDHWILIDKQKLPRHYHTLGRDSYDNCLAYLDEQLGNLVDELQRRGVFDQTLLVITSDHGEGLGEHDLFGHGKSLYNTEIRVPLLILLPSAAKSETVVHDTVSLRDLPATIVDLVGLNNGSPFPGRSLSRLWTDSAATTAKDGDVPVSELLSPYPQNANYGRPPIHRGALISLAERDFVYIRDEGDGAEQLFNEREDPRELTNRAADNNLKPVLEGFRERAAGLKKTSK
jgi:arylsulfatase A-like enzyme